MHKTRKYKYEKWKWRQHCTNMKHKAWILSYKADWRVHWLTHPLSHFLIGGGRRSSRNDGCTNERVAELNDQCIVGWVHLLPSHLPWNRLLPRCFPKKWWNAFSFQNKVHCSQPSTTNFLVPFLVDIVWKYKERKTDYMANTCMRGTQAWFVIGMILLLM